MSDDGLGIYVIEELQKRKWPQNILILEAGTGTINYLEEISHAYNLIVVDAIRGKRDPGSIYHLTLEDIKHPSDRWQDAHGFSLPAIIALAQEMTGLPNNIMIYGIEPFDLGLGCELSQPIKNALPRLITTVIEQLKNIQTNL